MRKTKLRKTKQTNTHMRTSSISGSGFGSGSGRKNLKEILKSKDGAMGWILLWAIGVPIPLLLAFFIIRGCT